MLIRWCPEVSERFPELSICVGLINGVVVEKADDRIQRLKGTVYEEVKAKYKIETLKDEPIIRAYRDIYWKLNIDPTKVRPSGEALLRRVLHGNELPTISTVVDAYNLASLKTGMPMSGFDKGKLSPPFYVRFARDGETFIGIGMSRPMSLTSKTLVLADAERVLCVYPYRDSDYAKITEQTKNVVVIGYGAPRVPERQLREAVETALRYIKEVSGGEIEAVSVLTAEVH